MFSGWKYAYIYRLNTKIRLITLCLGGLNYILVGCPWWVFTTLVSSAQPSKNWIRIESLPSLIVTVDRQISDIPHYKLRTIHSNRALFNKHRRRHREYEGGWGGGRLSIYRDLKLMLQKIVSVIEVLSCGMVKWNKTKPSVSSFNQSLDVLTFNTVVTIDQQRKTHAVTTTNKPP